MFTHLCIGTWLVNKSKNFKLTNFLLLKKNMCNLNIFLQTLVFGSYFLRWLSESKDHSEKVSALKPVLLDSLIKNIISSKNKTSELTLKVSLAKCNRLFTIETF
jgi:hypothetical protein